MQHACHGLAAARCHICVPAARASTALWPNARDRARTPRAARRPCALRQGHAGARHRGSQAAAGGRQAVAYARMQTRRAPRRRLCSARCTARSAWWRRSGAHASTTRRSAASRRRSRARRWATTTAGPSSATRPTWTRWCGGPRVRPRPAAPCLASSPRPCDQLAQCGVKPPSLVRQSSVMELHRRACACMSWSGSPA